MAINKNHLFDDINGVKCAIVETEVSAERISFLKPLLELNGYEVVTAPAPPPKGAKPAEPGGEGENSPPLAPEKFTIGVTDVTFNVTNAIFGRLLKTRDGKTVTLAYWQQRDSDSNDQVPYFEWNAEN
jgi:hypothetical protein